MRLVKCICHLPYHSKYWMGLEFHSSCVARVNAVAIISFCNKHKPMLKVTKKHTQHVCTNNCFYENTGMFIKLVRRLWLKCGNLI